MWNLGKMIWSAALSWARGDMEPSPSFLIASGAALMSLGAQLRNAPCGRLVGGALAPNMPMMSAPLPTTPAAPIAALSTSGTPTSGATAPPPRLVYSIMSWNWRMLTLSGTMLILVTKVLMSSCVVATF